MGFFTGAQKAVAETIYENSKQYLKPKDGKVHVIMFNSFSKLINQNFECENKYTTQLDTIITGMQNDGYEIIDIKFSVLQNQGFAVDMEGFNTLIMYK